MELLQLKAYAAGYRGCVLDEDGYCFFQCSRNGRVKRLKSYPKDEFADLSHFMAMMHKFIAPPSFLKPPVPIDALTIETLDRVFAALPS